MYKIFLKRTFVLIEKQTGESWCRHSRAPEAEKQSVILPPEAHGTTDALMQSLVPEIVRQVVAEINRDELVIVITD